ncbi:monovalent cation/H+ antiporter complex subunit F [Vallitaleaceae bacterium 9-2]
MLSIFFVIFSLMTLYYLFLLIKGPSVWDRLLAFNLFSVTMIIVMIIYALMENLDYLLDIAIVYALLGFIGIVFMARFIQRKGKI